MKRSLAEVAFVLYWVALPHDKAVAHGCWSIMTSACFAPPENMYLHWGRLGELTADFPDEPDEMEDWHFQFLNIANGLQLWLDNAGSQEPRSMALPFDNPTDG